MKTAAVCPLYTVLDSPLGPLYAAFGERGLARLEFGRNVGEAAFARSLGPGARRVEPGQDAAAGQLAAELAAYFGGAPDPFRTRLDLRGGTPFQRKVWAVLGRIPFGQTWSYGEVAGRSGAPGGARAAGQAVGANPVPIIVPCHRVVRASGALGGYGGGLPIKRWLLRHEGARP